MYVMLKRYQVYLNPHSVGILDEVAELIPLNRSQMIREAIEVITSRLGNWLASIKALETDDYSVWDEMIGSVKVKGKKIVNLSENVDEIYYR